MNSHHKPNLVSEYLNEVVNYGGIFITRHEMIVRLAKVAKSTGRKDWQVLVECYLQGQATMERIRRS